MYRTQITTLQNISLINAIQHNIYTRDSCIYGTKKRTRAPFTLHMQIRKQKQTSSTDTTARQEDSASQRPSNSRARRRFSRVSVAETDKSHRMKSRRRSNYSIHVIRVRHASPHYKPYRSIFQYHNLRLLNTNTLIFHVLHP